VPAEILTGFFCEGLASASMVSDKSCLTCGHGLGIKVAVLLRLRCQPEHNENSS
jgi:hypothetical protein